jgi:hypothetical protein
LLDVIQKRPRGMRAATTTGTHAHIATQTSSAGFCMRLEFCSASALCFLGLLDLSPGGPPINWQADVNLDYHAKVPSWLDGNWLRASLSTQTSSLLNQRMQWRLPSWRTWRSSWSNTCATCQRSGATRPASPQIMLIFVQRRRQRQEPTSPVGAAGARRSLFPFASSAWLTATCRPRRESTGAQGEGERHRHHARGSLADGHAAPSCAHSGAPSRSRGGGRGRWTRTRRCRVAEDRWMHSEGAVQC